jgi:hypothetical protein
MDMTPVYSGSAMSAHLALEEKAVSLRRSANAARARLLAQREQLERARRGLAELRALAAAGRPAAARSSRASRALRRGLPIAALLLAALALQRLPVAFRSRAPRRTAPLAAAAAPLAPARAGAPAAPPELIPQPPAPRAALAR